MSHLKTEIGVYGVVLSNNKILLLELSEKPMWAFPGGRMDETDLTLQAALKREVNEELGLNCNILNLFDAKLFENSKKVKKCCILFECNLVGDEIILSHEHKEYGYFTYEEIKTLFSEGKIERIGFEVIQKLKELKLII
jgi:ADP-ribose pyrophosphatase YjhB (NUDIX family)